MRPWSAAERDYLAAAADWQRREGAYLRPYADRETTAPPGRVDVPAAVSQFPADLLRAPREYAERFLDLRQWVEHDRGGQIAALEVPDLFAGDLRAFLADL